MLERSPVTQVTRGGQGGDKGQQGEREGGVEHVRPLVLLGDEAEETDEHEHGEIQCDETLRSRRDREIDATTTSRSTASQAIAAIKTTSELMGTLVAVAIVKPVDLVAYRVRVTGVDDVESMTRRCSSTSSSTVPGDNPINDR